MFLLVVIGLILEWRLEFLKSIKLETIQKMMEIQGQLVPANSINKILKSIPILGELLTGKDLKGFILTEFRLDGLISEPIISIRPLSSAPGILRDFLDIFRSDLELKNN